MSGFIDYLQNSAANPLDPEKKEGEQALANGGQAQPASAAPAQTQSATAPKPAPPSAAVAQPKYAMGVGTLQPPGTTPQHAKTGSNTGITQKEPTFFDFVRANQDYKNKLAQGIIDGTNTNTSSFGQTQALNSILRMGVDPSVFNVDGNTDYSAAQNAIEAANYAQERGGPEAATATEQQQIQDALMVQGKKDRASELQKRLASTDAETSDLITTDNAIGRRAAEAKAADVVNESAAAGKKRGANENRANVLQKELAGLDEELVRLESRGRATPEERARIEQEKQARLDELGGLGFSYEANQEALDNLRKEGRVSQGFFDIVKSTNEKGSTMYASLTAAEREEFDRSQATVQGIDDKLNQMWPESSTWGAVNAKGGKEALGSANASIKKAINEINENIDANEDDFQANQRQKLVRLEAIAGKIRAGQAQGKKTGIYVTPNFAGPLSSAATKNTDSPLSLVEREIAKIKKNLKYGADRAKGGDDFSYGF